MRATIATVALLAASPAWADGIAESQAPTLVDTVQLAAGHDYALEADGPDGAFVDLVEPNGHVLLRLQAQDSPDAGVEFRAPVGGAWHVRVFDASDRTSFDLEPDCPASTATHCALNQRNGGSRHFAWSSDGDWSKVGLRAGQSATFVYHSDQVDGLLVLHDARGREVARAAGATTDRDITLTYRAPKAGTYYLEAHDTDLDFPGTYQIGMH